jgi:putative methionine-R-sulfoxide reductase with GAF domain
MSTLPGKGLKTTFHISEASNVAAWANLLYTEMTAVGFYVFKNKPRLVTEVS